MKLLHLGDLHLGKSLNDYDLIDDQRYILEEIIKIAKDKNVDAILLAGDIYDRALPSEAACTLLDDFLSELSNIGIKVFMISGNHDSDDRLNYGSRLFESKGIYISAIYDGKLKYYTIKDEFGEVNIYMLPFVKASLVRHHYPNETIENYNDALRVIIESANIDRNKRNIILAHQFVISSKELEEAGEEKVRLSGSEGPMVQSVGLVEKVEAACFDDFDYAALGHIHRGQKVGRETVRYSGSPLKYSLSEANHNKTMPLITLGEKGDVQIELIALKPKRNLRHIKGTISQLLDKNNIMDTDDFIYATLTNEDYVTNAMDIFRQIYPYTVKIDYENSHTKEIDQVDLTNVTNNKPFDQLISEFYEMVYGQEISSDELELMMTIAKEAGAVDESN